MQIQRAPNFTPKFEYMLSTFCSNKHCTNYIVGDDDIYISKLGEISQLYHGKIFNGGFLAKNRWKSFAPFFLRKYREMRKCRKCMFYFYEILTVLIPLNSVKILITALQP